MEYGDIVITKRDRILGVVTRIQDDDIWVDLGVGEWAYSRNGLEKVVQSQDNAYLFAARDFGATAVANDEHHTVPTRDERSDIAHYHPRASTWKDMPSEDQKRALAAFTAGRTREKSYKRW